MRHIGLKKENMLGDILYTQTHSHMLGRCHPKKSDLLTYTGIYIGI